MVTGKTRVISMLGHPIAQVKSPGNLNGRFEATGQDVVVVPFDVGEGAVEAFFALHRRLENNLGILVTVPYKQAAFAACDETSPRARLLGACNVVRREPDGRLVGDMVDGLGYLAALAANGVDPKGMDTLVVGGGGVGSAIADALAGAGARRVVVLEIDEARRERLLAHLRRAYPGTAVGDVVEPGQRFGIIANATPLGMRAGDPLPLPAERIDPDAFVTDVVTDPVTTPFLEAARSRGCGVQTGPEMTVPQAALFARYLGVPID
ncbi:MAG: shikimate dehydrogenase [Ectothiorhodospiraceae bacterium]|nr:shikimate dehydrogenase [Ectothiorhodospiraceae bacterium]